jgi:hypothetical protein
VVFRVSECLLRNFSVFNLCVINDSCSLTFLSSLIASVTLCLLHPSSSS